LTLETSERVQASTPAVSGMPLRVLRSEGVILLTAALAGYFADLDEPYVKSSTAGATLYSVAHSYPAPAVLAILATVADEPLWQGVALLWLAHIGMDRALGCGLKRETGSQDAHLGRIGQ
jgi:hypothetical protein